MNHSTWISDITTMIPLITVLHEGENAGQGKIGLRDLGQINLSRWPGRNGNTFRPQLKCYGGIKIGLDHDRPPAVVHIFAYICDCVKAVMRAGASL